MLKIVKPALILLLICSVTTGALAYINSLTADTIKDQIENTQSDARSIVLPGADAFNEVNNLDIIKENNPELKNIKSAHIGLSDGEVIGACYLVVPKGYGGDIDIIIGIDKSGILSGITIGENTETPGLGTKAGEEPFLSQFKSLDTNNDIILIKTKETKDNEIAAISGATITSRAVLDGVEEVSLMHKIIMDGGTDNEK